MTVMGEKECAAVVAVATHCSELDIVKPADPPNTFNFRGKYAQQRHQNWHTAIHTEWRGHALVFCKLIKSKWSRVSSQPTCHFVVVAVRHVYICGVCACCQHATTFFRFIIIVRCRRENLIFPLYTNWQHHFHLLLALCAVCSVPVQFRSIPGTCVESVPNDSFLKRKKNDNKSDYIYNLFLSEIESQQRYATHTHTMGWHAYESIFDSHVQIIYKYIYAVVARAKRRTRVHRAKCGRSVMLTSLTHWHCYVCVCVRSLALSLSLSLLLMDRYNVQFNCFRTNTSKCLLSGTTFFFFCVLLLDSAFAAAVGR